MRNISTLNLLFLSLLVGGIHAAVAEEESKQEAPTTFKMHDGINFSGYVNATAVAPAGGKGTLNIDDLALLGSGSFNNQLNPFFEGEIAGVTLVQQGGNPLSAGYPHLILERLYNDSYLTNKLTLRIGKMLSPFGEWNLIHAAPLVWTTTRPMTTYHGFSEYTSGASLLYSGNKSLLPDMQLYVQPGSEIRPRTLDIVVREYEQVSGLHLSWPSEFNDKLGWSLQHAHIKNTNAQQTLIGFNFNKTFGPLEFETEAHHTHLSGTNDGRVRDTETGTYVQGAYKLNEHWFLTNRYEYFAGRMFLNASENAVFGFAYKPTPSSTWKLEYVKQYGQLMEIQPGLYASFARLF